jgi:hypothetical protein
MASDIIQIFRQSYVVQQTPTIAFIAIMKQVRHDRLSNACTTHHQFRASDHCSCREIFQMLTLTFELADMPNDITRYRPDISAPSLFLYGRQHIQTR